MLHEGRDLAAVRPAASSDSCEKLTEQWDYADTSADIPASLVPDDALVARCLGDLIDDWQRKGGRLSYEDVTRMSTKRQLDGHQLASLLQGLAEVGVSVSGLTPLSGELPGDDPGRDSLDDVPSADRDGTGMYLAEIGRYRLLWAEDEVRLGRLIKAGQDADAALAEAPTGRLKPTIVEQLVKASEAGRDAHDDLVLANLRLVVSIAKLRRYVGSGVSSLTGSRTAISALCARRTSSITAWGTSSQHTRRGGFGRESSAASLIRAGSFACRFTFTMRSTRSLPLNAA